jgi:hypothetical protein
MSRHRLVQRELDAYHDEEHDDDDYAGLVADLWLMASEDDYDDDDDADYAGEGLALGSVTHTHWTVQKKP